MEMKLSSDELEFMELTDQQFMHFGKIIYRTTELESALAMLAIHLRMIKDKDDSKFDRLYKTYYGSPGLVQSVRDATGKLPKPQRLSIDALLDICSELLTYRHAIAHGSPRKNSFGIPFMWRQSNDKRLPPDKRHVAMQIDNENLEQIVIDLKDAYNRTLILIHHYWPPFRGPNPRPTAAVVVRGSEVTREDILRPSQALRDAFERRQ